MVDIHLGGRRCQGLDPKWGNGRQCARSRRAVASMIPGIGSRSRFARRPIRPPHTLDEHVRIGGPFFDVLPGAYGNEPLPNGETRLHLSSQHRVSTDFNWYARFWTDGVMSDVQETILTAIQERREDRRTKVLGKPSN